MLTTLACWQQVQSPWKRERVVRQRLQTLSFYRRKREEFKTITGGEVNQKEVTDSESLINTALMDVMTLHIEDLKKGSTHTAC